MSIEKTNNGSYLKRGVGHARRSPDAGKRGVRWEMWEARKAGSEEWISGFSSRKAAFEYITKAPNR